MQTSIQAYQFLLEPIRPEAPCGDDLEYDPQYMELFIRIIPKEKKSIGGTTGSERLESAFEPVRWAEVEHDCLKLLARSKDLRLLMVLLRCRVQQAQAAGLCQGLYLLEQLLQLWPDQLYPRMTTDGEPDPLPRADALTSLTENQGLMADIRRLSLNGSGGLRLEVREVERSYSLPLPEGTPPPEAMRHRLEELAARRPPDYCALLDALLLARAVDALTVSQLGTAAPDLTPLVALLTRLEVRTPQHMTHSADPHARSASDLTPLPDMTHLTDMPDTGPVPPAGAHAFSEHETLPASTSSGPCIPPPRIANRHVAREHIRDIRLWFEEHEPSSPVCLLLQQAEQLVGKRFTDLVHCLPDELLHKWQHDGREDAE